MHRHHQMLDFIFFFFFFRRLNNYWATHLEEHSNFRLTYFYLLWFLVTLWPSRVISGVWQIPSTKCKIYAAIGPNKEKFAAWSRSSVCHRQYLGHILGDMREVSTGGGGQWGCSVCKEGWHDRGLRWWRESGVIIPWALEPFGADSHGTRHH